MRCLTTLLASPQCFTSSNGRQKCCCLECKFGYKHNPRVFTLISRCPPRSSAQSNSQRPLQAVRASLSTEARSIEARSHSSTADSTWKSFCKRVEGEWEGATAAFSADGNPQELPSQYVPKEFSDWDVTLYDWQSQCSMQPQAKGIKCLLKRIMPTVGCEADAQCFNEDKRQLFESRTSSADGHQPVLDDGSYTTASSLNLADQTSMRFEHCLIISEERRMRVVQHVTAATASDPWKLSSIELHNEKYDRSYNGGAELSGCGGGMSNFAETGKLDSIELQHQRQADSGTSYAVSEQGSLQLQDVPSR